MSAEENKTVVRRYLEDVWSQGDLDAADEVVTKMKKGVPQMKRNKQIGLRVVGSWLLTTLAILSLTLAGSSVGAQGPAPSPMVASAPVSAGCVAGGAYDPACDVNRDDTINIVDIQLTANHWGQAGTWTSGSWDLTGNPGTTPGTNFLGTTDNVPLEVRVNNSRALRIEPNAISPNLIGGFSDNSVTSGVYAATIGGGGRSSYTNRVTDRYGTVGGGGNNQAGDNAGTTTDAEYATVGGGGGNTARGARATVGGGGGNTARGASATVGGGWGNTARGARATVGGGWANEASGHYATVPGGRGNTASGDYSFAAGFRANANHAGTFVWADSKDYDFSTFADNGFKVRATGGVRIVVGIDETDPGPETVPTWQCTFSNGNSWSCSSSRSLKENLTPVDGREILERLRGVPIYRWNGKGQNPAVTHIGPTSEDFYAAFDAGDDDRSIATIDLDGVALAAIQGLYDVTQEQATEIDALWAQNAALEARLAALEEAVGIEGAAGQSFFDGLLRSWWPLAGVLLTGLVARRRWHRGT